MKLIRCYYSNCNSEPNWGVASSVELKNADGSPLVLYSCDEHYYTITTDMRQAGTRYTLFPLTDKLRAQITQRVALSIVNPEETIRALPFVLRVLAYSLTSVIFVVLVPPMTVYFGIRWLLGWRPSPK